MTIARIALVAVVVGTAGCAANEGLVVGGANNDRFQGAQLVVENTTTSSLRVYALAGGSEMPLGRVDALGERTVRLPYGIGSSVRLVVRPSALMDNNRRHVSEPIQLMDGQRITWVLRPSPGVSGVPHISTVRVFACASAAEC